MIDPYDGGLSDSPIDLRDEESTAREALRCDVCRALVASLPALLDHYDRRH